MNKKATYIAILLMVMAVFQLNAQNAKVTFEEKNYDFGAIEEKGGKATHVFEFTNTGNAPLIIQRVTASCGCTTPEWTNTPVEPGKKGTVTVAYNPLGRPGSFTKTISVYSNASNELEQLTITGNVIYKKSIEEKRNEYRNSIGDLKLNQKSVLFGEIYKGNVKTATINVFNDGKSNMSVKIVNLPHYITYSVSPDVLKPNEEGVINFSFNSNNVSEWGVISTFGTVVLDGKKIISDDVNRITFDADIVEDFSKMSIKEKRNAPILEIKSSNIYIGKIKKGKKVRGNIELKNVGEERLEVRRILNDNTEITLKPAKLSIKRGKTEKIQLDIDTKYIPKGDYKKVFTVITNDPMKSKVVYTVQFSVI